MFTEQDKEKEDLILNILRTQYINAERVSNGTSNNEELYTDFTNAKQAYQTYQRSKKDIDPRSYELIVEFLQETINRFNNSKENLQILSESTEAGVTKITKKNAEDALAYFKKTASKKEQKSNVDVPMNIESTTPENLISRILKAQSTYAQIYLDKDPQNNSLVKYVRDTKQAQSAYQAYQRSKKDIDPRSYELIVEFLQETINVFSNDKSSAKAFTEATGVTKENAEKALEYLKKTFPDKENNRRVQEVAKLLASDDDKPVLNKKKKEDQNDDGDMPVFDEKGNKLNSVEQTTQVKFVKKGQEESDYGPLPDFNNSEKSTSKQDNNIHKPEQPKKPEKKSTNFFGILSKLVKFFTSSESNPKSQSTKVKSSSETIPTTNSSQTSTQTENNHQNSSNQVKNSTKNKVTLTQLYAEQQQQKKLILTQSHLEESKHPHLDELSKPSEINKPRIKRGELEIGGDYRRNKPAQPSTQKPPKPTGSRPQVK